MLAGRYVYLPGRYEIIGPRDKDLSYVPHMREGYPTPSILGYKMRATWHPMLYDYPIVTAYLCEGDIVWLAPEFCTPTILTTGQERLWICFGDPYKEWEWGWITSNPHAMVPLQSHCWLRKLPDYFAAAGTHTDMAPSASQEVHTRGNDNMAAGSTADDTTEGFSSSTTPITTASTLQAVIGNPVVADKEAHVVQEQATLSQEATPPTGMDPQPSRQLFTRAVSEITTCQPNTQLRTKGDYDSVSDTTSGNVQRRPRASMTMKALNLEPSKIAARIQQLVRINTLNLEPGRIADKESKGEFLRPLEIINRSYSEKEKKRREERSRRNRERALVHQDADGMAAWRQAMSEVKYQ